MGFVDLNGKASTQSQSPPDLRLIHLNDVYHCVEARSSDPVGGVARFQTVVNEYRNGQPDLLTFFSGDAYNPSLESSVTKGRHMVPFLNAIGTSVACVGNHDLDFGVSQFSHLSKLCHFPWLLANVLDPALGDGVPIGNCQKTVILNSSNGFKIGVIGLAEREWLATINSLPPNLIYKSATVTAEELVPGLRAQGCDLIIALTHAREPNDIKLAEKTSEGLIDLILGGHDHFYNHEIVKSTHILRSGTDFQQLSYIEARRKPERGWDFQITRREIVRAIPEDPETLKLVEKLSSSMKGKLEKPVGYTAAPLDARFTTVRLKESNLGNFVCDLMMHYYECDCCIMASGTIRGDQVYPPGVLRMKDLMTCFPFEDPCVVIKVTGQAILDALENSVSTFPALEGRFPQVAGLFFEYDPTLAPNKRVLWTTVRNEPLDKSKIYKLCTRGYMARGKDGFTSLLARSEGGVAEEVVSEENGILISMLLRQYFLSMKILGRWRRMSSLHGHWDGVKSKLHETHNVKNSSRAGDRKQYKERTLRGKEDSESLREKAPVDFHHGGKLKSPAEAKETAVAEEMVEDDSDGSINLDEPQLSACNHPLTASDVRIEAKLTHDESDRLYHLARTYGKYWMEVAGVDRRGVGMVDEHGEHQIPSWTRGIAPRVEGRIIQTAKPACATT